MSYLEFMGSSIKRNATYAQRTIGYQIQAGSVFLSVVTLTLGATFGLLYFVQINFIAQKGLQITQLEQQILTYQKKNTQLANAIDREGCLTSTKRVATEELALEEVQDILYWQGNINHTLAKQ